MNKNETRVTDEKTGGQKGTKLAQLGAVDAESLIELAEVAGYGADKYDAFNFLKGYDWSLSFNAMQRHALLFWAGEDLDDESNLPHMAHAAWHCLALLSFARRKLGTDDRYKQPTAKPFFYGELLERAFSDSIVPGAFEIKAEPFIRCACGHHGDPLSRPGKGEGPGYCGNCGRLEELHTGAEASCRFREWGKSYPSEVLFGCSSCDMTPERLADCQVADIGSLEHQELLRFRSYHPAAWNR